MDINFPIDNLFNSHIAIFGNTGSGKSNTLASLYQELLKVIESKNKARFILFDFNGEYSGNACITRNKKVFNLSTLNDSGDKLPIREFDLLSTDLLSILSDATEKTQKPFLKRAISFYNHVHGKNVNSPENYFKNILKNKVSHILQMSDKSSAFMLLDSMEEILPRNISEDGIDNGIRSDLDWHNKSTGFTLKKDNGASIFLASEPSEIENTIIYSQIDKFSFSSDLLSKIIGFLYLQLISDVISTKAQNEHIAPCINKLKSKRKDIGKIFISSKDDDLWNEKNFIVINLHEVNLDMKKTLPLLLAKKVYSEHKNLQNKGSLNIIIDEAHNILSKESFRESESWKDYRLETFEEIIKEGRKFGVFVTISSQRPNDISSTIISQAHNYFIHRLINQKDLATISNAVSYIDRVTEESIPTLPIGTCIFSGIATQLPLKIKVKELEDHAQPHSKTIRFQDILEAE